jgi:cellulose synthase/poly-beta-1,6-N-acetylglucosamine synthase-like glycosyltransferase
MTEGPRGAFFETTADDAQASPEPDDPIPPEIAFLESHGFARADLLHAARLARASGVMADQALLAEGLLSSNRFYELLALHLGVAYLHGPLAVADDVPIDRAIQAEMVPLAPNPMGFTIALAPRGKTLATVLSHFDRESWTGSSRVAITTPQRLAALIRRRHHRTIVREASHALPDWNPRLSARSGWSIGQKLFGFLFGFAVAIGLGASPIATYEALCLLLSGLFLAMVGLRLVATLASVAPTAPPRGRVPDHGLPIYTVVVPLYREDRVVPRLIAALSRLDYPASRLDIKIVLESDDVATLEALHRQHLPDRFEVLLAPPGEPKTKPRALNVALRFARGRYLVIYDAEDEPEPGQLREAVQRFAEAGPELGCLQARLAIDNGGDSWLARQFALEYAVLFDVINPGLARLGLPIALGGTSNHFRIEALRNVNGWDAWNVTEDIDLGIRLARFGYRVGMLASTTFEEAPHRVKPWLGQRQRWQKGWIVTIQTHSRNPRRLFADLGVAGGLTVFAVLCGTVASALFAPLFAAAVMADAAFGPLLRPASASERAWTALVALMLLAGAASLVAPALLAMRRRALPDLRTWPAFTAPYLALISLASWRALFEAIGRPYAWTKTEHGVAKQRMPRS